MLGIDRGSDMLNLPTTQRRSTAKSRVRASKLAIASVGCAVAIGASVVGGFWRSAVDGRLRDARGQSGTLSSEIARRDRLFDIANSSRIDWEQTRVALRLIYATTNQIYTPGVETLENLIINTLTWGEEAAYGRPPTNEQATDVEDAARLIAHDEAERSNPANGPNYIPRDEEKLAKAVSLVTALRHSHIREYWKFRQAETMRQQQVQETMTELERSVRRIDRAVVALQIAGLIIVLLKDFVPDAAHAESGGQWGVARYEGAVSDARNAGALRELAGTAKRKDGPQGDWI